MKQEEGEQMWKSGLWAWTQLDYKSCSVLVLEGCPPERWNEANVSILGVKENNPSASISRWSQFAPQGVIPPHSRFHHLVPHQLPGRLDLRQQLWHLHHKPQPKGQARVKAWVTGASHIPACHVQPHRPHWVGAQWAPHLAQSLQHLMPHQQKGSPSEMLAGRAHRY